VLEPSRGTRGARTTFYLDQRLARFFTHVPPTISSSAGRAAVLPDVRSRAGLPKVKVALRYFGPEPSAESLWKVYEVIRDDVGGEANIISKGWRPRTRETPKIVPMFPRKLAVVSCLGLLLIAVAPRFRTRPSKTVFGMHTECVRLRRARTR